MLIEIKNASHTYFQEQPVPALQDINLKIKEGEFIGLVGQTGSGKSTLVQLFNGLIKPSQGQVLVDGLNIADDKVNLKEIRQKIGLVFQYPEHQLFEETVYDDIAFGPRNLGLDEEEVATRVQEAMELVALDYKLYRHKSPFNLSGGQQRKVAIAGVLAMKPKVLILDEPSAGLDPQGREQLIHLLMTLHRQHGMTVILISHRMEEIARLATRVIVMSQGKLVLDGTPEEVFSQVEKIRALALDLPTITEVLWRLKARGLELRTNIFTIEEAIPEIVDTVRRTGKC